MTMLPIPGGDLNIWGTKLNTMLIVAHDGNTGRLLSSAIVAAGGYLLPAGGIPATDMAIGVQGNLNLASSSVQSVNSHLGPSVTLKASDVAGGATGTSGQVLTTDGSGNGSWSTVTSGVSTVNGRSGAVTLAARDVASGAAGSIGQFLATDGAGNGSWLNPLSAAIDVTQHGVIPTSPTGTDVTAALNTLISTQVAAAVASGTNVVELYFPPGVYRLSGALTQGGATKGNAQIPLPIIAPTAPKVTLILRSSWAGGDTLPHWQQSTGQRYSGACLYSTLTGQVFSGSFGTPSILGGPTSEQGYGNSTLLDASSLFNNMHVIIDGISVCGPGLNPTVAGFDFFGLCQATVGHCGAFVDATPASMTANAPSNNWTFGLRMPAQSNNDLCNIYSWSCEGYYTGLVFSEHTVITRVLCVTCICGIRINSQTYADGNVVLYASIESCLQGIQWDTYTHAMIYDFDSERAPGTPYAGGNDINDGGNNARGYVGFEVTGPGGASEGSEPVVNGCGSLKIVNIGRKSATAGTVDTFPGVPANNTPYQNPFWRDALMAISGGTITAIQLNTGGVGLRTLFSGTSLGVPGILVPFPSGATIQLTYTGSPTWIWTLI